MTIVFLSMDYKYVIDLNKVPEGSISRNITHVQLRIDDFKFKASKARVYIEYSNINGLLKEIWDDKNYCKDAYKGNENQCFDEVNNIKFLRLITSTCLLSSDDLCFIGMNDITISPSCFCDSLLYSMERDFMIRDTNQEYILYRPNIINDWGETKSNLYPDNCKLIRAICQLATSNHDTIPKLPFYR